MAEGQRREMRIGGQVSRSADGAEERLQRLPVLVLLADHSHIIPGEPCIDLRRRGVRCERTRKDAWIRGQSEKAEKDDPGEAQGVFAVDGVFLPSAVS